MLSAYILFPWTADVSGNRNLLFQDPEMHRSPHLVPYPKVDDAIKKANRDTASETVRTLLVYGYNLDPPTGEQHEGRLNRIISENQGHCNYCYHAPLFLSILL